MPWHIPYEQPQENPLREMLFSWNQTEVDYPQRDELLHRLVEAQVERTPEAIAVCFGETQITYGEINARADQLASLLRWSGVSTDSPVGIGVERSPELLIGLLGILKAGGAYVPLDPDYPQERLALMIEDSGLKILLTQQHLWPRFTSFSLTLIPLDGALPPLPENTEERDGARCIPENLAYIIYTSGSTGRPKGVMNTHRGICNRLLWMQQAYQLSPSDRVLQKTSLSFDVSIWECFWPLIAGAAVVLAEPGGQRDSAYLVQAFEKQAITTTHFVPSLLYPVLQEPGIERCTALRRVICSGEALPFELEQRCLATLDVELYNLYGPTEAAIDVTHWTCERSEQARPVPIGRPLANIEAYVLDQSLQPLPPGETGELYIGGIGLARGYMGRPDLTAERFVPHPFSRKPAERLYRTGDLARYRADGVLEFLGRLDDQVKIRGFRIEPGEVQFVLAQHAAVQQTVVVAREDRPGDHSLAAYVVPDAVSARPVHQLLTLQQEGALHNLLVHILPNGMPVLCLNKSEVDFLYQEIFEAQEYLQAAIVLHNGDCVFDVGANIGLFTLFASQHSRHLSLYAFEPLVPVFDVLRLNARLYGLSAQLLNYGLASESHSEVPFAYYPHCSILSGRFADESDYEVVKAYLAQQLGQVVSHEGAQEALLNELLADRLEKRSLSCQVKTLSEVIREQHIAQIDLLKIDVEKSELDVLSGIQESDWPKIRQIAVEVYAADGRLERIVALLRQHGYSLQIQQSPLFKESSLSMIYAVRTESSSVIGSPTDVSPREAAVSDPRWLNSHMLVEDIYAFLHARLPDYMVPDDVVLLAELPLTPNGKVDKKALPAPAQARQSLADRVYQAPRTPLEKLLVTLWGEFLGIEHFGIHDHFFRSGGHSLLATQLMSRMRALLGISLPLRAFFEHATVASFARYLEEQQPESTSVSSSPVLGSISRTDEVRGDIPLSYAQESVWFFQQLDSASICYQFQATIHFTGVLEREALRQSLQTIVQRHEVYRTTFPSAQGTPVQRIHAPWEVTLPVIDLEALQISGDQNAASKALRQLLQHQFDVTRLPLVQWVLLRLGPEEHVFVHIEHHLVHDGWSFNLFLRELRDLYRAYCSGQPSPLPLPVLQFADFVCWQRQWVQSDDARAQLAYWQAQLANLPPMLQLPTDYPRPNTQRYRGHALREELPGELCAALREQCRRDGVTLFMLCLAAFLVLLYRSSGESDICIGTGLANRRQPGAEALLGMLVNTLALRFNLSGSLPFHRLLEHVRQVCLEAYEHQEMPFQKIVEALQPERSSAYTPLYQILFSFHDAPLPRLDFPNLHAELAEGLSNGSAKADLNVILIPRTEQQAGTVGGTKNLSSTASITLIWEYNSDLFTESTMRRMLGHFQTLLRAVLERPTSPIAALPLMDDQEIFEVLTLGHNHWPVQPGQQNVCALIEQQAHERPDSIAVTSETHCLTYGELHRRANQLAHYLRQMGVGPEVAVGIFLERSLEMVIAALAVLQASGAYMTLDTAAPLAHLAVILTDASPRLLLTREALRGRLPTSGTHILYLDSEWDVIARQRTENLPLEARPENLAYLIYTSGSTGVPKGVQLVHRGLSNLVHWHTHAFELSPRDRATHLAGLSFDASVWELWPYLASGASLFLVDEESRHVPERLYSYLSTYAITLSFLPTPLAERFLSECAGTSHLPLRYLLTGGDALRLYPVEDLPFTLVNNYGPAENTVVATSCVVPPMPRTAPALPPIGAPIEQNEIVILDERLQLVPIGIAGEICLGGASLARGYLGQPGLTAEKFIPHPFSTQPGARLYRTGDSARYRFDGSIEFLGRRDSQVKIRGFRIELEEIEVVLAQHPLVQRAVVIVSGETHDTRLLIAYIQPLSSTARPEPAELRKFLRARLPHYMVPSAFLMVEAFPLSPNGKILRQALPLPAPGQGTATASFHRPATPIEQEVARIWAALLSLDPEQISVHDDFFALGGHSFLATRALAMMRQSFHVDLPLAALFEQSTISSLAPLILSLQLAQQARDEQALWLDELQKLSDEEVRVLLANLAEEETRHG